MRPIDTSREQLNGRRSRRLGCFVFSVMVMIGMSLASPASVEATCGDYLSHHHMHDAGTLDLHDIFATGMPEQQDFWAHFRPGQSNSNKPFPLRRCNGPSCQQAPLESPLSVPVVAPEPQDRWGWMFSIPLPSSDQSKFRAAFSEPVRSLTLSFRLERPPRR